MTSADLIRHFAPRTAPERRLHEAALNLLESIESHYEERPPEPEPTREQAVAFWQHYNGLALHKPGVAPLADLDIDCVIHALKRAWER